MNLAVDVGFGQVVGIDQGKAADGRARQGLDSPGADPADADDADVRLLESLEGGAAV